MSNEYWIGVEKEARERLEALKIMLDSLDAQRAERAKEILQLEQLLISIAPFTTESPLDADARLLNNFGLVSSLDGLDLAEACRKVLKENDRYMSPREVRDMLEANNYDLTQHTNPLASIHGVLKRLVESGNVLPIADSKGVVYKWNTSAFKRSPLSWVGQRNRRTYTKEEIEASERKRAQARAIMAGAKKIDTKKIAEEAVKKALEDRKKGR